MLYTATFSSPYETQTNEGIINKTGHIYDRQVAEEKYLSAPANCQSAAAYVMSCVCGEAGTDMFTVGELDYAKHSFVNDICTRCFFPEGLLYTINNDLVTITGFTGKSSTLVIPDTVEGKSVVAIQDSAFYKSVLKSIVLPSGLLTIGESAFEDKDSAILSAGAAGDAVLSSSQM